MKQTVYFFLCTLFCLNALQAQYDDPPYGCHMVKSKVAGIRYSPEQLAQSRAALERSDTFDILHYTIDLQVTDFGGKRIRGATTVRYRTLMEDLDYINLDLEVLTVDSVYYLDEKIAFEHTGPLLKVTLPEALPLGDTAEVKVYYGGSPMTSASGFGGFYFEEGYAYNLGIGLNDQPHNYGRAWFPCFDNFVERSTYEYRITHAPVHKAYCVGTFLSETELDNGLMQTVYRMDQPIPTYLSSIAVSSYGHREFIHEGQYGQIPVRLIARPGDLDNFERSFARIGDAVDAFEKWYGPYQWERVGYVITTRGAMEHPTNVAYPAASISGGAVDNRLMAHELCHHWWGNVVTLKTSHNMWIKEGPAEYGAHLFTEHVDGSEAFQSQVKANSLRVLRRAHVDDDGFRALSPMPEDRTYGTHTYYKGAMMIHNIRAYLGDSLFSAGMKAVLADNAYSNIDAYDFRDQLTAATGVDMTQFFEDWIFRPGFPTFEVDSMLAEAESGYYRVSLHIEQKLYGRDVYMQDVPLEATFYTRDGQEFSADLRLGGAQSQVSVEVPFLPDWVILNASNKLNPGFLGNTHRVTDRGNYAFTQGLMSVNIAALSEPAFIHIEHHFAGADGFKHNPDNIRMGKNRHWRVVGHIPDDTQLTATFEYTAAPGFDDDLVKTREDSLILLYRQDASADWIEHPNYQKRMFAANDGQGQMRVLTLLPGEYALANGEFTTTSVSMQESPAMLTLSPNPAGDIATVSIDGAAVLQELVLRDMNGKMLKRMPLLPGQVRLDLSVRDLPSGVYFVGAVDKSGNERQHKLIRK